VGSCLQEHSLLRSIQRPPPISPHNSPTTICSTRESCESRGDRSERQCTAIQSRGRGGSAPHPSTTCSITQHKVSSPQLVFLLVLLGLQQALKHKAGKGEAGFIVWLAPHHLKNNRAQLQIWELTCAGIFDGTGLCLGLRSSGCLRANFCCLVQIHPCHYC